MAYGFISIASPQAVGLGAPFNSRVGLLEGRTLVEFLKVPDFSFWLLGSDLLLLETAVLNFEKPLFFFSISCSSLLGELGTVHFNLGGETAFYRRLILPKE